MFLILRETMRNHEEHVPQNFEEFHINSSGIFLEYLKYSSRNFFRNSSFLIIPRGIFGSSFQPLIPIQSRRDINMCLEWAMLLLSALTQSVIIRMRYRTHTMMIRSLIMRKRIIMTFIICQAQLDWAI